MILAYFKEELDLGVVVLVGEPGHGLHQLGHGHRPALQPRFRSKTTLFTLIVN